MRSTKLPRFTKPAVVFFFFIISTLQSTMQVSRCTRIATPGCNLYASMERMLCQCLNTTSSMHAQARTTTVELCEVPLRLKITAIFFFFMKLRHVR
ncbi:unnamed protein product [Ixodes pacificus]